MMMLTVLVATTMQALPVQSVVRDGSRGRASATAPIGRAPVTAPISRRPAGSKPRVVVDAGHGGVDAGGPMRMGASVHEKDITLQVALKVGQALRQRGVDVVYTRTRDTLIALSDRGRIANQSRGEVFISIHVNAANPGWRDPGAARGFETYFLAEAKTEDARRVEQMENESARYESGDNVASDDPLNFILSDMQQNEHLRESSDLAEIVQRHLGQVHPGPSRGVKQAGFRVLVTAFMPAVLVEIGFGTNVAEAEFLASPVKQREMARAIADATTEYLARHDRRVGAGPASNGHD
jgi:N-acetylmuramoyl-L-alanine amidase